MSSGQLRAPSRRRIQDRGQLSWVSEYLFEKRPLAVCGALHSASAARSRVEVAESSGHWWLHELHVQLECDFVSQGQPIEADRREFDAEITPAQLASGAESEASATIG